MAAGWEQKQNNPDVFTSTIPGSSVGQPGPSYVYEYNVKTGSSSVYLYNITGNTRLYDTNGSSPNIVNVNSSEIKSQQGQGLNFAKLQQIDKQYALKATDLGFTTSDRNKLKALGRYSPDTKSPTPTTPGGGNPDAAGGNAGIGTGTGIGAFTNISSFNKQYEGENYGVWTYPKQMNLKQDYMIITTYNYKVADVFSDNTSNSGSILDGASLSKRTLTETLGSVTLPMPSNISEANMTGWGENSLSGLTAGIMGRTIDGVNKIASVNVGGVLTEVGKTAQTVFNEGAANSQIKQLLTLNAAASVVKKLGMSIDAETYRARVTGTVINPNLEMLFNGPKLRQFQFQFKLAPRSAEEAKQVRGIIKFFKKSMAPKRSKVGGDESFFLGAPNIFKIKFKNGEAESNSLPTLKTCALVNFNVNYTADGFYSAYRDGQPISVSIDLAFAELTPIYNDNYGGADDDRVGFRDGIDIDKLEDTPFDASAPAPTPVGTPGPAGQGTSPARTLIQGTGQFQPSLGLPPA